VAVYPIAVERGWLAREDGKRTEPARPPR